MLARFRSSSLAPLGLVALLCITLPPAVAQGSAPGAAPAASAGASHVARPLSTDPELEAKVVAVAQELRCLVCQNETLAASNADLAVDLRQQIRLKLQQGQTQQQIVDFMVARYGDFVLYRPPVKPATWLLWLGPFVLLLLGAVLLWRQISRRRSQLPGALSDDERQRAAALLGTAAPPADNTASERTS